MSEAGKKAELFLNDKRVGYVVIQGFDSSWGYGTFEPLPAFTEFAPLFGRWSLLMHADDEQQRISEAASEELRSAEFDIDSLDAKIYWASHDEWTRCLQVNIDGNLIEWKKEFDDAFAKAAAEKDLTATLLPIRDRLVGVA